MSKNAEGINNQSFNDYNSNRVSNSGSYSSALAKVPEVTLIFWLIKINTVSFIKAPVNTVSLSNISQEFYNKKLGA